MRCAVTLGTPRTVTTLATPSAIWTATSTGAALVLDGQFIRPLPGGSRLVITRSKQHFQLVRNPARKGWDTLVQNVYQQLRKSGRVRRGQVGVVAGSAHHHSQRSPVESDLHGLLHHQVVVQLLGSLA